MITKTLLGERIKELRKKRALSQEQLAEKVGLAAKYLSQIETGDKSPSLQALDKFAAVLNVEIRDLFDFRHLDEPMSVAKDLDLLLKSASEEQLRTCLRVIRALVV
jgi:transcriptional regulator with XRE-family HTH domain